MNKDKLENIQQIHRMNDDTEKHLENAMKNFSEFEKSMKKTREDLECVERDSRHASWLLVSAIAISILELIIKTGKGL